jgi:hypothetical protein
MQEKSKLSEQKEIIAEFMKAKFGVYKESQKQKTVLSTPGFHQGNRL